MLWLTTLLSVSEWLQANIHLHILLKSVDNGLTNGWKASSNSVIKVCKPSPTFAVYVETTGESKLSTLVGSRRYARIYMPRRIERSLWMLGVDRIHQTEIYDRWTGLGPTALWQRPVYGPYQCQLYPYWTYGVLLIPLVTCEGAHFLLTVSQQMGKCVRCSGIFRQYVIQGRRKIHFYMDSLTVYFKIVWKYYLYKNFKI